MSKDYEFLTGIFKRKKKNGNRKNRIKKKKSVRGGESVKIEFLPARRYEKSLFFERGGVPLERIGKDRGAWGEYLTYDALRREKGKWLFNLYLPKRDAETEIDALFICTRGIFLLETKNMTGRVYGSPGMREWSHTYRSTSGIRKSRIFNPLLQNAAHKRALEDLIGRNCPIFPAVVFGKNCVLLSQNGDLPKDAAIRAKDLRRFVRSKPDGALSEEEIERIFTQLEPYTNVSDDRKKSHVDFVTGRNL